MVATPEQLAVMSSVNQTVNAIPYVAQEGPDEKPDWWSDVPVPGMSWVCRDYTEDKADKLKSAGFNPMTLTTVLLYCEPGTDAVTVDNPQGRGYHAVLGVNCGGDTWIMDSRFDSPYLWTDPQADYQWHLQQIPGTESFRDASAGLI